MDYRDQVDYIRSHQGRNQNGNKKHRVKKEQQIKQRKQKNKKEMRPVKVPFLCKLLWLLQFIASGCLMGSMLCLKVLPAKYMVLLAVLCLLFLLLVLALQKSAVRRRKRKGSGKAVSLIVIAVCLFATFYALKVNAAFDRIAIGEKGKDYQEVHGIDVTQEPFNVYISGIDVYGKIDQTSRSDVNIIATVNPKTHKILLTTTPRDYYVNIPGVTGDEKDKLTHAGNYGVETSIATLENLYQIQIPFFVRVNFTSVEEIVDIMGGIDVNSEYEFTTSKAAGEVVDVKKGKNHFNGKQALAFVRERKALAMGDNQRGRNQEILLKAMIEKMISPSIIVKASSMINSVSGNAETNLSENQMKSLIRVQLSDMSGWDIESVAAEGNPSGKQWCYSYPVKPLYVTVPYEDSIAEVQGKMNQILSDR